MKNIFYIFLIPFSLLLSQDDCNSDVAGLWSVDSISSHSNESCTNSGETIWNSGDESLFTSYDFEDCMDLINDNYIQVLINEPPN